MRATILALVVAGLTRPTWSDQEFPACHVCGEGFVLKNLDRIIELPQQPDITCAEFERAALGGMLNPLGCSLITKTVVDVCDCERLEFNFPFCSICGVGSTVVNDDNQILIPGLPTLRCHELASFGANGFIDPDTCLQANYEVDSQCGCEAVRNDHAPCRVCGEGFQIESPTAIISFPGYRPQTCEEFSDAASQGFIDPRVCPALVSQVDASCGCKEIVFTNPPCSVCGTGFEVVNPGAIVSIPGQPSTTCRDWQEKGYDGEVTESACSKFLDDTFANCGCREKEQPSEDKLCFVCGDEDAFITNGERVVLFPHQPSISCDDFAQAGVNGGISEELCPQIVDKVISACQCSESSTSNPAKPHICPDVTDDGCSVCGKDSCVTLRNVVISLPNATKSLCGALEDAGSLGLVPLDQCEFLENTIWTRCGCAAGEAPTIASTVPSPALFQPNSPSPMEPSIPSEIPPTLEFVFETSSPVAPSISVVEIPTLHPTTSTTQSPPPTLVPTPPTPSPTSPPIKQPTPSPTASPVDPPTSIPTASPVEPPTSNPTVSPINPPAPIPTVSPVHPPTSNPTVSPVDPPTSIPTASSVEPPTSNPTVSPINPPAPIPTVSPVHPPTSNPSISPVEPPTSNPTVSPVNLPTSYPTASPVHPPTSSPTPSPINPPTSYPTLSPINPPTLYPTMSPLDLSADHPVTSPIGLPISRPTIPPSSPPVKAPTSIPTKNVFDHSTSAPITKATKGDSEKGKIKDKVQSSEDDGEPKQNVKKSASGKTGKGSKNGNDKTSKETSTWDDRESKNKNAKESGIQKTTANFDVMESDQDLKAGKRDDSDDIAGGGKGKKSKRESTNNTSNGKAGGAKNAYTKGEKKKRN